MEEAAPREIYSAVRKRGAIMKAPLLSAADLLASICGRHYASSSLSGRRFEAFLSCGRKKRRRLDAS